MKKMFGAVLLAVAAASVAPAQESGDDILTKIINAPLPQAHRVDGTRATVRSDEAVQGGKSVRIVVPGKSEKAWTVAVASPIQKPVRKGDQLVLAFWAKLVKAEPGASSANLPYNGVQLASPPYTALFTGEATIGPEWKLYEVRGKADKDYGSDTLNATLHLATGKQTIDLGPIFVLNLGQ